MRTLVIVLAVLALCVSASAKLEVARPVNEADGKDRVNVAIFYDDIEGDVSACEAMVE